MNDQRARRSLPRWLPWVAAAVIALVAGAVGGLIAAATQSSTSTTDNACKSEDVARKVLPSVVTIGVEGAGAAGTGSGEIIRADGYILTNDHVIAAGANGGRVHVVLGDGSGLDATIRGRDPRADLAVIKVQADHPLPVIDVGDSDRLEVGRPVVALGAPLGLSSTVTAGIVSALNRTVEVPGSGGSSALLVGAIQTDAAINPGNSGGALTDCDGRLVGVPTAIATVPSVNGVSSAGSVGLGFAIPSSFATKVADELIANGRASHAYLGIQVTQIPPAAAQQAGTSQGLFVLGVARGGPAANAGLRPEDIITEIDGAAATNPNQLLALVITKRPGDKVPITYLRAGQRHETTLTLTAIP